MTYPKQFEQFWKLYPGRTNKLGRIRKQDKLGAFTEWQKLKAEDRLRSLFSHPVQDEYTPDARKWLKWRRWEDEDCGVVAAAQKTKLFPLKPARNCSLPNCSLPAVWKGVSEQYDYYRCVKHIPAEVKELYT